ncbi:MAG TPA: aspartate-semialdehyde dehydrogenase [Gammaproteobacteria bacterium]|nr:aspartate-semialdehyde dehydrogenase [Gammaproteobacteria bacterium]
MKRVGFVGWRGMVGSVLLTRMRDEADFDVIEEPVFFSTSQTGQAGPEIGSQQTRLHDAFDLQQLSAMDVIVTCQGGDYTTQVFKVLREEGWRGYWIDAASSLRMTDHSVIVLDPVNRELIDQALDNGVRDFIGGNCTVSLMMMAMAGLLKADLVEWISVMTYQAASGAGARAMRELLTQMAALCVATAPLLEDPAAVILDIDRLAIEAMRGASFPVANLGAALAGNLLPWIDRIADNGQSREEWKGYVECNKILGRQQNPIAIDGLCVRIGAMRCHSQALTVKLCVDLGMDEIRGRLAEANDWVRVVENTPQHSITELTPSHVTGTLEVAIGRLHKMRMGPEYLTAFTVGDQLLWGAAEPLRRMLKLLLQR